MTFLVSCSRDDESNVRIRLSNISTFEYKNIIVNTSTGNVNFENLNSNQSSEYKTFGLAYRYAFIELEIDDEVYTLQPNDYVGETPLKSGNYAYEINADPNLTITLIVE